MCDWAITVVLFALGLAGGRAAEAVPPAEPTPRPHADVHAPAHRGGDEIAFPVGASGFKERAPQCPSLAGQLCLAPTVSPLVRTRPRLLWCRFRTTAAIFSAIARGCSMARSRPIKRGACPFVKKALSAHLRCCWGSNFRPFHHTKSRNRYCSN